MRQPRHFHTATRLNNGNVLVAGGRAQVYVGPQQDGNYSDRTLNSAEIYDANTRAFALIQPMLMQRERHTATLLADGRVLIVGGRTHGPPPPAAIQATTEIYDPQLGLFVMGPTMGGGRYMHSATRLPDGKVLIAGGFGNAVGVHPGQTAPDRFLRTAEIFDPGTNTLAFVPDGMVEPRAGHTALLDDTLNQVHIDGGSAGQFSGEYYDVQTNRFVVRSLYNGEAIRRSHVAIRNPSQTPEDRFLVGGTWGVPYEDSQFPSALKEDGVVIISSHHYLVNLIINRTHHSATLLPNGNVLVVGGMSDWTLRSVEIVERPFIGPFGSKRGRETASLPISRMSHTATLLTDAAVLIAGGMVMQDQRPWNLGISLAEAHVFAYTRQHYTTYESR